MRKNETIDYPGSIYEDFLRTVFRKNLQKQQFHRKTQKKKKNQMKRLQEARK